MCVARVSLFGDCRVACDCITYFITKCTHTDAIVVVLESHKSEVQSTLEKCPLKIKLEFATIPSDSDYGTADSLRHIKDR